MDPNLSDSTSNSTTDESVKPESVDVVAALAAMQEKLERSMTGAIGRIKKETENSFTKQISALEAKIASLGNSSNENTTKETIAAPVGSGETTVDPRIKTLEETISNLAKEIEKGRKEVEVERQQSQVERLKAQKAIDRSDLVNQLKDRIVDPLAFLALAEGQGQIEYVDGKFVKRDRDELLDRDILTPITHRAKETDPDYVERLLATNYPYLAKPRPGSGTGASAGSPSAPRSESKYFSSGADRADLMKAAIADPAKVMQDLLNTAK